MSGKHRRFSLRRMPALCLLVGAAIALLAAPAYSDGPQFDVAWWTVDGGGGGGSGGPYRLRGTAGQPDAGALAGGAYTLQGGFWGDPAVEILPRAVSNLSGNRTGGDLALAWSPVTHDTWGDPVPVDHYVVYRRAGDPYFQPTPSDVLAAPVTPGWVDAGVLGDGTDYTYLVTAVHGTGLESALSNRLGAYDVALTPAPDAGQRAYNLIALSLDVPGVSEADTLAAYVGPGVYMVLCHDAATQAIEWWLPGLAGTNFSVEVGGVYFLYLDETAAGVVSLVGEVPPIGTIGFDLARPAPGGSCAYNFISVPLDRDDLVDANSLASDIGGVYSVSQYNALTQDLTWWLPGSATGVNFAVHPGYPYIVCLDETTPPSWP